MKKRTLFKVVTFAAMLCMAEGSVFAAKAKAKTPQTSSSTVKTKISSTTQAEARKAGYEAGQKSVTGKCTVPAQYSEEAYSKEYKAGFSEGYEQ